MIIINNAASVLICFYFYYYIDFISQHSAANTETHTNDIVKNLKEKIRK